MRRGLILALCSAFLASTLQAAPLTLTGAGAPMGGAAPVLWTPANYAGGVLEAWHDPSNPAGITQSGGFVSVDADLSGNGHDDTRPTPGFQPALLTANLNGLDVEQFINPYTFDTNLVSDPAVRTYIVLLYWTGATNIVYGAAAGNFLLQIKSGGQMEVDAASAALIGVSTSNVPSNAWTIISVSVATAGSLAFRINGSAAGAPSISPFSWLGTPGAGSVVGGNNIFAPQYDGRISERIINSNITLSNTQLAEGYLAWKYGLQTGGGGILPVGHPYYSAPPYYP